MKAWPTPTWRGCHLCDHGTNTPSGRMCTLQQPGAMTVPRTLDEARARGGVCGPEANFLSFPGLDNPARKQHPITWRAAA